MMPHPSISRSQEIKTMLSGWRVWNYCLSLSIRVIANCGHLWSQVCQKGQIPALSVLLYSVMQQFETKSLADMIWRKHVLLPSIFIIALQLFFFSIRGCIWQETSWNCCLTSYTQFAKNWESWESSVLLLAVCCKLTWSGTQAYSFLLLKWSMNNISRKIDVW